MELILAAVSHYASLVLDLMALIVIAIGAIEAFVTVVVKLATRGVVGATAEERHAVWMNFARWLVAGLTFQLAADIVETAIAPSWDEIGRLGAIAVIRTFLNFFLERDMRETRERDRGLERARSAVAASK